MSHMLMQQKQERGLIDAAVNLLFAQMAPTSMAPVIRELFWQLHARDRQAAMWLLRDISVDWDEVYGWLGGTDPD